jgi:glutathione S-transferase
MIKLYFMPPSGNSYKVRILLSLLNVPHEKIVVDHIKREHKEAAFLKLNPRGEVPVIDDDGVVIWDSAACLAYIARKFGGETWLPVAPAELAEVMQWIALAAEEIQYGLQYGRRGVIQDRWTAGTLEQCQATARVALDTLEGRLHHHAWLALERPTLADIACFPYVETAPEAKISLAPYPAVSAWLARCRALPGWPVR